jgi:hypothetical protein
MRLQRLGLSVAFLLTLLPRPAMAQSEFIKDNVTKMIQKIGVHVSTNFADPLDTKEAYRDGSYGVSIGLAPGRNNGWRYPFGIGWFTEEFVAPNGAIFGQLRARPFYGGIGYGWHFGKLSTGIQMQAGWSFNTLKPHGDPVSAFGMLPGAMIMDVDNSWSLRPQFKVEYFLHPKFTVRSSLNYVFMNPTVTVATPTGVVTDRWNASNVSLAVGVGVYPFRK